MATVRNSRTRVYLYHLLNFTVKKNDKQWCENALASMMEKFINGNVENSKACKYAGEWQRGKFHLQISIEKMVVTLTEISDFAVDTKKMRQSDTPARPDCGDGDCSRARNRWLRGEIDEWCWDRVGWWRLLKPRCCQVALKYEIEKLETGRFSVEFWSGSWNIVL